MDLQLHPLVRILLILAFLHLLILNIHNELQPTAITKYLL